jgi:phosphohistidine phosphatase SixA
MEKKQIVSLICTHQARIRCLLHDIYFGTGRMDKKAFVGYDDSDTEPETTEDDEFEEDLSQSQKSWSSTNSNDSLDYSYTTARDNDEELELESEGDAEENAENVEKMRGGAAKAPKMDRFKNGCVLEFKITTSNIQVKLVYDGIVDEEKPDYVYYVSPSSAPDPKVAAGKYKTTLFKEINIPNVMYSVSPGYTYIFYLIRHGQGEHNILKGMSKKWGALAVSSTYKDPSLTNTGVQQAIEIGQKLQVILDRQNQKVDYLFASDLKRTRQTLYYILQPMDGDPALRHKQINILQCSEELNYTANKNCDSSQWATPNENISLCNPFKDYAKAGLPNLCQNERGNYASWKNYTAFYGTGTRSNPGKYKPQKCRDTDMIKQAILYIQGVGKNDLEKESDALIPAQQYYDPREEEEMPAPTYDPRCSGRFYRWTHPKGCKGYQKVPTIGGTKRGRAKMTRRRGSGRRLRTRKRKNVRRTTRRR